MFLFNSWCWYNSCVYIICHIWWIICEQSFVLSLLMFCFIDAYKKGQIIPNSIFYKTCLLDILDTAGQEEYSSLRDQYTRTGDCFLIIYSVTDEVSFKQASALYDFLKRVKSTDRISAVRVFKVSIDVKRRTDLLLFNGV